MKKKDLFFDEWNRSRPIPEYDTIQEYIDTFDAEYLKSIGVTMKEQDEYRLVIHLQDCRTSDDSVIISDEQSDIIDDVVGFETMSYVHDLCWISVICHCENGKEKLCHLDSDGDTVEVDIDEKGYNIITSNNWV